MKLSKINLAKAVTIALCSTVLFCGCTKNSDVLIKVNDQEITRGQYYEDFNKVKDVQLKNAPKEAKSDTSFIVLSLKEKYTNDVILQALLSQEFDKRDIKATQEEIEAKKKQLIAQIGSEEQFKEILKQNNISEKKLNSDIELDVKMDKLVTLLGAKEASDAEVQAFYNKNKERFNMPERIKVSHILIETNPETIKRNITDADKNASLSKADIDKKVSEEVAKKEALAKEILTKAQANPKDFAKLATEYSEDKGSAQQGGDLGYITRETVVKEFGDAAFSQKVGVVGPLVKSAYGTHIIVVYDKAKAGLQPYEQVKNDLKAHLTQQNKIETMQKFINGLKNNAKIEYIDETLKPENIEKQINEALKKQIEEYNKKTDELKNKPQETK